MVLSVTTFKKIKLIFFLEFKPPYHSNLCLYSMIFVFHKYLFLTNSFYIYISKYINNDKNIKRTRYFYFILYDFVFEHIYKINLRKYQLALDWLLRFFFFFLISVPRFSNIEYKGYCLLNVKRNKMNKNYIQILIEI